VEGNRQKSIAHAIGLWLFALMMAYYMIQRQTPYREVGADLFDRLQPEDTARRLIKRLEGLGYQVTLKNPSTEARLSLRRLFSSQHRS
jgi:hypothetical protein